jgi:hypothetical protein
VCAGMLFATLFGIFIVPVLFVAIEKLASRIRRKQRVATPPAAAAQSARAAPRPVAKPR